MLKPLLIVLAMIAPGLIATAEEPVPVEAVPDVDLNKYCGKWYEIARLPNKFQKKCAGNTTAEYTLLPDGKIRVMNRCIKEDGTVSEAEGIARKEKTRGSNAKLKVRFAPSWLGWLPFVWGTYWVIDLAPDYSYAVVGEPSRKYLWILSRTPEMQSDVYATILARVKRMGFDTDKLIVTKQNLETN